jgi:hypothetical protein
MKRVLNASSFGSDKKEDDSWTGISTWSVNDQIPPFSAMLFFSNYNSFKSQYMNS